MRRLLYRSRATSDVESSDVFDIVATSARRNPARGISGFLLDYNGSFLQFNEGSSLAVEALYKDLIDDRRHEDLEVLLDGTDDGQRWFSDWAMKHLISFGGTPALEELRHVLGSTAGADGVLQQVENFLKS